jgi:hypothetical protein
VGISFFPRIFGEVWLEKLALCEFSTVGMNAVLKGISGFDRSLLNLHCLHIVEPEAPFFLLVLRAYCGTRSTFFSSCFSEN